MYLIASRFVHACVVLNIAVWGSSLWAASEPQLIYRCGNAYTNQPDPRADCKPMAGGGHVTVIEGTRVQSTSANVFTTSSSTAPRIDGAEQRQRDTQAHMVLEAELQRALKLQTELLREWNSGEPQRRADEFRQPQKYQERVAQLRDAIQRAQADVAGLQRELARLGTSSGGKP